MTIVWGVNFTPSFIILIKSKSGGGEKGKKGREEGDRKLERKVKG